MQCIQGAIEMYKDQSYVTFGLSTVLAMFKGIKSYL